MNQDNEEEIRVCRKCNTVKTVNDFVKSKIKKGDEVRMARRYICKECEKIRLREANRKYYMKKKNKLLP